MANTDGPRGLKVIGSLSGGIPQRETYQVDAANAAAIFTGHPVALVTDGNVDGMSAASDDYLGVVEQIFNSDGLPVKTLAASTAGSVVVCISPDAILEVQTEDGGTALTSAAIGDCSDLVFTHAGNASTGRSGVELSETLAGDGASAQFKILSKVNSPDNAWGEHYVRLKVVANEHAHKASHVAI